MKPSELQRLQRRDVVHGRVPLTFVHLLAAYLHERGVALDRVLDSPYRQAAIGDLEQCPAEGFCQMLLRAAVQLDDPLLGLHLGQSARIAQFGALGYVMQSCENLGQALIRLEKYHRLIHDINPIEHRVEGPNVEVCWGIAHGRPGALFDEAGIAAIVKLSRDLCGQAPPLVRVDFVNPRPSQIRPYQTFFGCPLRFDQPVSRLILPLDSLGMPLAKPDPMLRKLMEDQVDSALSHLPEAGDLVEVTRRLVANLAKDGMPELDQVARAMRLGPRMLYRRLAEQGLSFRSLREAVLRQMAEQYLRDPNLSFADMAQLLGYSDQTAFTRAVRRWTGTTPTRWRALGGR
ncbi:AraC family transcriptional regulator [Aquabacterium sp.]|uniref:AraC family transcriptional regulator n=1 Tax=Aquabacterium sp. TaxID=1872578 RepID=UPI0035B24BB3